jgi:hypothetical protein
VYLGLIGLFAVTVNKCDFYITVLEKEFHVRMSLYHYLISDYGRSKNGKVVPVFN